MGGECPGYQLQRRKREVYVTEGSFAALLCLTLVSRP